MNYLIRHLQSHLSSKNWIDSTKTELSPPRAKYNLTRSQDLQIRNVQNTSNIIHPSLQRLCMMVYCCCSEMLLECFSVLSFHNWCQHTVTDLVTISQSNAMGEEGKTVNQYLVLSTSKFEPVLEVAKSCLQSELVPRQYTLQGDTAYWKASVGSSSSLGFQDM